MPGLVLLLGIAALILYLIYISLPSISEGPEDDPSWYMDVESYEDAVSLKEASDYILSNAVHLVSTYDGELITF